MKEDITKRNSRKVWVLGYLMCIILAFVMPIGANAIYKEKPVDLASYTIFVIFTAIFIIATTIEVLLRKRKSVTIFYSAIAVTGILIIAASLFSTYKSVEQCSDYIYGRLHSTYKITCGTTNEPLHYKIISAVSGVADIATEQDISALKDDNLNSINTEYSIIKLKEYVKDVVKAREVNDLKKLETYEGGLYVGMLTHGYWLTVIYLAGTVLILGCLIMILLFIIMVKVWRWAILKIKEAKLKNN